MPAQSSTLPRTHYRMWGHHKVASKRIVVSSGGGDVTVDWSTFTWTGKANGNGGGGVSDNGTLDLRNSTLWGLQIIVNGSTETLSDGDIQDGVVRVMLANHQSGDPAVQHGFNMAAGTDTYYEGFKTSTVIKLRHVDGGDDIEVLLIAAFDEVS